HFAYVIENLQGFRDQASLDVWEMHVDDGAHGVRIRKLDVVEKAAPQEGIGQLFLVVGRNNNDGAVPGLDVLVRFVNIKLHAIEFLQQVIGELDVGLVDLIDQQHGPLAHGEGLPQLALADIVADVGDAGVTELAIAQAANRVILVEALQRLGRRFDVPLNERGLDRLGDFDGENRLAGAGLALDEQRSLQGDGGVDRDLEIHSGDVGYSALELHWWWTAPRLAKRRASLGGEGVASKRARCGKGERPLGPSRRGAATASAAARKQRLAEPGSGCGAGTARPTLGAGDI